MKIISLIALLVVSFSVFADDETRVISITKEVLQSACVFENKIYSEGAAYKTSDGRVYKCMKKAESFIWLEASSATK